MDKKTTIRILLGLEDPTRGSTRVFGQDSQKLEPETRARIGYLTEGDHVWAAFAFCFGLPGLVAFRLASHWTTWVSCPSCAHKRPIEAEECPSCHQSWPPPKSTGTEIFADSVC